MIVIINILVLKDNVVRLQISNIAKVILNVISIKNVKKVYANGKKELLLVLMIVTVKMVFVKVDSVLNGE